MSTSKTAHRMASHNGELPKTKAELEKLLKKAQAEVEMLLAEDEKGTLTQACLKTSLCEVKQTLMAIAPFER